MRFHWLGLGLGILLLTAPASAEQDEVFKKYKRGNSNAVGDFFSDTFGGGNFISSRPSKRKKLRQDSVIIANTGKELSFTPPRQGSSTDAPVSVKLLPQIEEGNLPYVPEKLELLRAARFEEPRPDEAVAGGIYDALLSGKAGAIRVTTDERQAILAHYRSAAFKPLWIENNAVSERAKKLEAVFAAAGDEALEPDEFILPAVDASDPESLAAFDLKMTAAVLKYARQASGGRLLPNRLSTYNDLKPERVKALEALKILAYSPFPADYLMRLHPTHPAYAAFKAALAELRKSPIDDEPIPGGLTIKRGQVNFRIPVVRERLARLGFLLGEMPREQLIAQGVPPHIAVNAAYDSASELLDPRLAQALREFQKEKNLKPTGALDIPTVRALNSRSDKQDMIKLTANMERLRWLPKRLGERYIFVNQAAYELNVIDKGEVLWRTKVVVGKPETQTSAFHDELETVVFNPPWGVPPSIVTNEMLPILWHDPGYLDKQGFKVYDQSGKVVKSRSINWAQYGSNPPFSIQQPPGDDNALGELKFLFPNSHAIYMHDTPSKSLFSKPVRAFSHGCVRVENPKELARIVLGMSPEKIAFRIASGVSETVAVPRKLPVHLTYFTAWPGQNGKINFYTDIYGRDAAMTEVFTVLKVAQR